MSSPALAGFGAIAIATLITSIPAFAQVEDVTGPAPTPTSTPTPTTPSGVLSSAFIADVPAADAYRSAGYRNGTFYIHSPDEVFRLYIMGRVHADWIDQFGPGTSKLSSGSGVNDGFFLRRARMELAGEFYETWQWQIGAEFASATSIDNAAADQGTPSCKVDATTGALDCSTIKQNAVEAATVKPIPTDAFVNYGPSPWVNLEVGQFYLPFTLENRISDNTTPFLERSLAVRGIGAPLQRDIGAMFWGESPDRVIYYAAAVLNGDGPNRVNVDSRYDFAGRVVVRPFAIAAKSPTRWAQVGVSAKGGSRDPSAVGYDLPSFTTQDGYAFWKPTYKDSFNRTIHIIPSNSQWGLAGDIYVSIANFDVTAEFIYSVNGTREAVDGMQLSPFTERTGNLNGYAWYGQVGYWIVGDHDVVGHPSYGRPIHVDLSKPQKPAEQGVQVLAKFEQLHMTYDGASRRGSVDAKTPNGDIDVNALEFGVNYWATRHLRVGANYAMYMFPESDTSHTLDELSVRVGVQF